MNTKIQTTIFVFVSMLMITSLISYVNADSETKIIVGVFDGNRSILIVNDDINIIKIQDEYGMISEYYNSEIKLYRDGGFSMKNRESLIAVWIHPIDNGLYKVILIDNGDRHRFLTVLGDFDDVYNEDFVVKEPKSSIGADINKWNIPTQGRNNHTIIIPEKEFNPDTLEIISNIPHFIEYKHTLNFDFGVIDNAILSETDQRVKDATINISLINPFGEDIIQWSGITNNLGYFGDSWYVEDNEVLGQWRFNVTASFDNFTQKNTFVNFFVIPLDDDSTRKCPLSYFWNSTSMICEEDI